MSLRSLLIGFATTACLAIAPGVAAAYPSVAHRQDELSKQPTAVGSGGAVASEKLEATRAGLEILGRGGSAADAAVAVASTLCVTDPYVAGIGGGGYFVYYDARTHAVHTIDGRETAPASATTNLFIDPATGTPLPFPTGRFVNVPEQQLLSPDFGRQRACLIDPDHALTSPVAPGDPFARPSTCAPRQPTTAAQSTPPHETDTNHFVVADRWGDVVSYTNTIEQLGGSGIVVPGRGFLLNNELTDFDFAPPAPGTPDPNLPAGGKRPRSSMSRTIVLKDGHPFVATGAAGVPRSSPPRSRSSSTGSISG